MLTPLFLTGVLLLILVTIFFTIVLGALSRERLWATMMLVVLFLSGLTVVFFIGVSMDEADRVIVERLAGYVIPLPHPVPEGAVAPTKQTDVPDLVLAIGLLLVIMIVFGLASYVNPPTEPDSEHSTDETSGS